MNSISTEFDRDKILSDFLTDYIDNKLDKSEREVFESYLDRNEREKEFARKAFLGKQVLSKFSRKIKASPDFEARLALRIALDEEAQESDLVNQ